MKLALIRLRVRKLERYTLFVTESILESEVQDLLDVSLVVWCEEKEKKFVELREREELIRAKVARTVVYADRGELKYQKRLDK